VAENSAVFKQDLKEASEGADRRSCSREFHSKARVTAVEKAHDAKSELTASLKTDDQMMTGVVWPVDSLTAVISEFK